jgi:uncharacterized NAD(P)/FAD-binding protein YdhS
MLHHVDNHGASVVGSTRNRESLLSAPREHPEHLVICGGGASAVLLLHALRRRAEQPLHVTLIEERASAGTGTAYSTASASHLLNVPAGRMSADAENPNDFVAWLNQNFPADGHTAKSFVPRKLYGAYLKHLLAAAAVDRRSPVQVTVRHGTIHAIERRQQHWTLTLADEKTIDADAVVVATGNAPPRPYFAAGDDVRDLVLNDPWDADAKADIPRSANVALVGSGLTAVDVAIELLDRGHRGQIRMISRHGLLPRKHAQSFVSAGWLFAPYPRSVAELMRRTRREARSIPGHEAWRTAIDALRPNLPAIWGALTPDDKARFLRHVRPFWEVHRHRMAPEIAARVEAAIESGRIVLQQGRLQAIESAVLGGLSLRVKASGRVAPIPADVAINCTGPECDPTTSRNPLIVDLLSKGLARPDPLHLGIDTDEGDRLIAADGRANQNLYAVGPVARGRLWEVTAIPEIRQQATALARKISPSASEQANAYTI